MPCPTVLPSTVMQTSVCCLCFMPVTQCNMSPGSLVPKASHETGVQSRQPHMHMRMQRHRGAACSHGMASQHAHCPALHPITPLLIEKRSYASPNAQLAALCTRQLPSLWTPCESCRGRRQPVGWLCMQLLSGLSSHITRQCLARIRPTVTLTGVSGLGSQRCTRHTKSRQQSGTCYAQLSQDRYTLPVGGTGTA